MYEYGCIIRRVVDGDTVDVDIDLGFDVWLNNQRIRLAGIDTPESRTRDLTEKVFGNYATQYVENLLPVGSRQTLVTREYDATGKYGRILGDFLLEDDTMLVMKMLIDHVGVAYEGQNKDAVEAAHLANRQILLAEGKVTL